MKKSVLVTGASSGIGLACVARFHGAGWNVLATVRKPDDAAQLQARFAGIRVLMIDLVDSERVAQVVGDALAQTGGVDCLVNNAGASIIGAAEELSLDDFRAQMDLNLFAAIKLTQLALPFMRAQSAGRIVQVSSGFGRIALPMFSAYCASKYALEGFSEALAGEVKPFGIHVTLIEPGPVKTRFDANRREARGYAEDGPYAGLYRAMRARLSGSHEQRASSAEDVAEAVFNAATATRPALRVAVGGMGVAAVLAARLVPDAVKSWAVGRMTRA